MKNKLLLPSLLTIALLQACGGGGGDDGGTPASSSSASEPAAAAGSTTAAATASADTGSVSAPFVAGSTPRYQLTSTNGQSFGKLDSFIQAASGAMTTLSGTVLSGASATKDIAGDATFAMGRWAAGTVTSSTGAQTLTGTDNRAYHYLAVNAPAAFPVSGTKTCDSGVFTAPTYVGGSASVANTGAANGSASLSFGAGGAAIAGSVNVTVAGVSGSASLNGTAATVSSTAITGAYLSGGAGAAIQIGEAGTDAYNVAVAYGTGATGCAAIASPVPGGPQPVSQQPGNVVVYRGGQRMQPQGSN